ncbi:Insect cuticle protein [Popillia japonica]|uniref:Insect cuticle protein n=1 Tax=Popillia japonica TaxID=7064 RepID=A0AAW1KMN3_POPJA
MIEKILLLCCALELVKAGVGDIDQLKDGLPAQPYAAPEQPDPTIVKQDRPIPQRPVSTIVKQVNNVNPDGSYQYSYETSDGTAVEESGRPSTTLENQPIIVSGSFKYTAPEGSPISVQYSADENGFQLQGSHLPGA